MLADLPTPLATETGSVSNLQSVRVANTFYDTNSTRVSINPSPAPPLIMVAASEIRQMILGAELRQ